MPSSASGFAPVSTAVGDVAWAHARVESQSPKPRVLHVVPSVSALRGGVCVAIWTTLRALRLRGITADLVATDDDGVDSRLDVPSGRFIQTNDARVRYFPRQARAYTFSLPLFTWLTRHVGAYDIVHTHGMFSFASVAAAWAARMSGVPYVMCPHGMLTRWARNSSSPLLKRTSMRMVEGPLLAGAARVHFTSQSELEECLEIAPSIKGVVFPLAFDMAAEVARIDAAGGSGSGGRPTVLFLSRIHPKKGLDLLLRAFANVRRVCPDALLVVAGEGAPEIMNDLRQQADRLGVSENVRWAGFVAGEAKRSLLASASVFVLPSWSENFAYAAVEAMAARVPVIVTRDVGVSDIVERAAAGIIVERSVDAVTTAIIQLLRDDAARWRMGESGRRAVREALSLDTFGARLESLYDAVLLRKSSELSTP